MVTGGAGLVSYAYPTAGQYSANGRITNEQSVAKDQTITIDVLEQGGLNPVPEPSTMLLLVTGLIGLSGWGRKKFKK